MFKFIQKLVRGIEKIIKIVFKKEKKQRKPTQPPKDFPKEPLKKPIHPWRICPKGQHYRVDHDVQGYTTASGKSVDPYHRSWTCVKNPSEKDQLYSEEIDKIAIEHFAQFKVNILGTISDFGERGNIYDHIIQGWTKYWNDILKPSEQLNPRLIKALIASESSFNPKAWNGLSGPNRARGLMQVLDGTLPLLTNKYKELLDHQINVTEEDMLNPNFSICVGIRWLFRKKQLARAFLKREVSWLEAVIMYKGIPFEHENEVRRLMENFDKFYGELS